MSSKPGSGASAKSHWERAHAGRPPEVTSWFQMRPERSLALIGSLGLARSAGVIDVGGGSSRLVDELLAAGYSRLSVLDVSKVALETARARLGSLGDSVQWIEADITRAQLPAEGFDVWHDRAVFHFLTEPEDRQAYRAALLRSLKIGGHIIIATFAEDGPIQCSGLPVVRYSADALANELGPALALIGTDKEIHHTPTGVAQSFIYCCFRRVASRDDSAPA